MKSIIARLPSIHLAKSYFSDGLLGNMTNLFLVVSGIFFFWFVVGLVVDLKECKFQWRIFRSRIAHSFVRQQPQSQ